MDKDGDKKVLFGEFFAYMQSRSPPDPEIYDEFKDQILASAREMYNELDKNGDGHVELEEFKEKLQTEKL